MEIPNSRRTHSAEQPADSRNTYLFVLPWELSVDSGGVNQVVKSLYDGIRRDGQLEPRVLVMDWEAREPVEELDNAGRSVVRFRMVTLRQHGSFLLSLLSYVTRLPTQLWRIWRLVNRYRVAVVNCHYVGASDLTWIIAKAIGVYRGKVFLSLHGRDIRTLAALPGLQFQLWRWVLERADAIVACSDGLARETVESFHLGVGDVAVIHNGFDQARLVPLLESTESPYAYPPGGPALLNLGTFEHKKGHDVLLRAFKKVLDKIPEANLTIMGRSAETMESTLQLVKELGIGQSVTIRVDVPHATALSALRAADVFVLSSRNEAFSIALLEAGALGKPIVATDVCGVAELIEDGEMGILVPADDVDRLAHGILAMLDDANRAAEYGRRVRQHVITKFSSEQTCRSYLRLAGYGPVETDAAGSVFRSPAVQTVRSGD